MKNNSVEKTREKFMKKALKEAQKAAEKDEVPVGAVIIKDGKVFVSAHNTRNQSKNAVSHAEINAIVKACRKLGDWRLNGCDIYVTLEPCAMCVGACVNARIDNIFFGAYEKDAGCCGSVTDLTSVFRLNHTTSAQGGIMQEECGAVIKRYFESKRKSKNS